MLIPFFCNQSNACVIERKERELLDRGFARIECAIGTLPRRGLAGIQLSVCFARLNDSFRAT